jgi:Ca2+-binding RTX toxin-like protein
LLGLAGNDALNGGVGADTLIGGLGDDSYTVDNLGDNVFELSGEGNDIVNSSIDWTLGANLERLYLTGNTAINASGNGLANVLYGNANSAANILAGGLGNDSFYVGVGDIVVELENEGSDIVYSAIDWALGANIERISLTGTAAVSATGNELANTLQGNANSAANVLTGGLGNDSYYVGVGDSVVELLSEGIDTVYSVADYTLSANVEKLLHNVVTAATLTGNELANTLRGNAGNDTLLGLAGNDTLTGGLGDDFLFGGAGDDVLVGSAGFDHFVFEGVFGKDRVNDFVLGQDLIQLSGVTGISGFGDLDTNLDTFLDAGDAAVQMLGADMLIVFGGDQIRIVGQVQLHSLDFVFA